MGRLIFLVVFALLQFTIWQMREEKHRLEVVRLKLESAKLMNEKLDMLELIRWLQQTREINLPVILRRDWQEYQN